MDTPVGTVVSVTDRSGCRYAAIEVDVEAVCPRCAAGKGCGAGILGAGRGRKRVEVMIEPRLGLRVGDRVQLNLAADTVLRAAILVYGIPLIAAVAAAAAAYGISLGDLGAAIAAIVGLSAGLAYSRQRLQRAACLREFTPTVAKLG